MMLTIASDVLFDREPASEQLGEAAARAFGVRPSEVAVGPLQETPVSPGFQVVMQRQPEIMPGDFPIWYQLTVATQLIGRVDHALNSIARDLGLTMLTDADGSERMSLHLPDGAGEIVRLAQGEDDSIRLTPTLKRRLAAARQAAGNGGRGTSKRAIAS